MKLHIAALLSMFLISLSAQSAWAGTVTRSLSDTAIAPGSDLTVTLTVDVQAGEDYFAVDDNYSTSWAVQSTHLLNNDEAGHMKNATTDSAQDAALSYVIRAPSQSGDYSFSGLYQFEGGAETAIAGPSQVTVGFCTDGAFQPCQVGGEPLNETGECAFGQEECVGAVWSGDCTSPAPVLSMAELCDGLDNDCDGSSDENWPELGSSCTAGLGICQSSGHYVCRGDGSGSQCDAVAGTPGTEQCPGNGIDDDCDGQSNEYKGDTWVSGTSPCDCIVDITDLTLIGSHFAQTPSDPGWVDGIDLVANNEIDIFDLVTVGAAYGNDYSAAPWNEACS